MEQEIGRFINDLKAREQARQDELARQRHQEEIKRQAFDRLRLQHIDEAKYKRDIFYLIFCPTNFYNSDNIDKNNIIYNEACDYYRFKSFPLTRRDEFDFWHKGDEILKLVDKDDWNEVINGERYGTKYWDYLVKICPDFLRSRLERLKS